MEIDKIVQKPFLRSLFLSVFFFSFFGYAKQDGVGWAQKCRVGSGELGVGTAELLHLLSFFSPLPEGLLFIYFFFYFLKPVKNVPAP